MPFSMRDARAGGVLTRVLEAGEGPPLILSHGTGGHLEAFLRNVPTLACGFIAFDFVGHGYSDGPDEPCAIDTYRARLEWLFAPASRELVTDELVKVRYSICTRPGARTTIGNVLVRQDPDVRRHYTWTEEWCARINAETLIFCTDQDPTTTPGEGELLERQVPCFRLLLVAGAGHWPQWERPDDFEEIHRRSLTSGDIVELGL
jgi:pimeloyl-ACP methyl ester carboxylesterase